MALKNETLVGHIVFATTGTPNAPASDVAGRYNASVSRQGNGTGTYIVAVGSALGPPDDVDLDCNVSSTPVPGAGAVTWNGWNVTDLGVNALTGNREYLLTGKESIADGTAIVASDTADIIVRFTVRRVNPRVS